MAQLGGGIRFAISNSAILQGALSNDMVVWNASSNQSWAFGASNSSNMLLRITSNGFVGIGASNPITALQLGPVNTTGLADWLNWFNVQNISTGGHKSIISMTDCNTLRPNSIALTILNDCTSNNIWSPGLSFAKRHGGYINEPVVLSTAFYQTIDGNWAGGDLCVFTRSNTQSLNERIRVCGSGNVGIGTSNPLASLHVVGSAQLNHTTVYNTSTAGWYNLGLWDCSAAQNNGAKLVLRIIGSTLYVGGVVDGSESGGETRIYLTNLNNASLTVVNVDGSWCHTGGSPPFSAVKVVQNGTNRYQYYVYAFVNTYTQHVAMPETTFGTIFTPQFTSVVDPGANSATVQQLQMSYSMIGTKLCFNNISATEMINLYNSNPNIEFRTSDNANTDAGNMYWRNSGGNYVFRVGRRVNPENVAFPRFIISTGNNTSNNLVDAFTVTSDTNFVGIGTSNPLAALHVVGNIRTSTSNAFLGTILDTSQHAVTNTGDVRIGRQDAGSSPYDFLGIACRVTNDSAQNPNANVNHGHLLFYTWGNSVGNSSERMRIRSDGYIGIGTTTPSTKLHVNVAGNSGYGILQENCAAADAASKSALGTKVQSTMMPMLSGASLYTYATSATASTYYRLIQTATTYFTGQHAGIPDDSNIKANIADYVGLIVSSADTGYVSYNPVTFEKITGKDAIQINECLPNIKLACNDCDPAVFGVISDRKDNGCHNPDGTVETDHDPSFGNDLFDRVRVNSIGEGAIWVCNINGNISNGDYITSSTVPGIGQRQSDDLFHNYTVAKATMSCGFDLSGSAYRCEEFVFEGTTYKKAFIGCTYHCG